MKFPSPIEEWEKELTKRRRFNTFIMAAIATAVVLYFVIFFSLAAQLGPMVFSYIRGST